MKMRLSPVLMLTLLAAVPCAEAAHYSSWSAPVNLGSPINSSFVDAGPTLSKNGLSLYFHSTRPCGEGDTVLDVNIWVSQRPSTDSAWGEPRCLDINVADAEDSAPVFSRDGHWMYFVSSRAGGLGAGVARTPQGRDIWLSWRADVHDDYNWTEPVNATAINSAVADAGPSYFENEGFTPQLFFTSNRAGTFDIYVVDVVGSAFGTPQPVNALNTTTAVEARPAIRFDGLEIYLFRGAGTNPSFDIYSSTRPTTSDDWTAPELVENINVSGVSDQQPFIAADRETLFFASDRPGTAGNLDIWMSTRTKIPGKQ